jgi:hypothetical protein
MATPKVAPSSRVASLTAEPMPAFPFGHDAHDRLGGRGGGQAHAETGEDHLTDDLEVRGGGAGRGHPGEETPTRNRPVATTALLPTVTESRTPTSEPMAMQMATGRIRTPVLNRA